MAWFLFIDESGQDHRESPYEVLAGIAIRDDKLWGLIQALHDLELSIFGRRYSDGERELKGAKILKKKVFSHARLSCQILPGEIPQLAREALDDGARYCSIRHFKALSLAKLQYVSELFGLCQSAGCKVFASVVETRAPKSGLEGLRKDYAYLFERFCYHLEDESGDGGLEHKGIIVFDELEKTRSHLLVDQCHRYFKDFAIGRQRAQWIIPEPFFVHSDLTTGVQIADLVAYTISWAFRTSNMQKPAREELQPYAQKIAAMRCRALRMRNRNPAFEIWSIAHITDLRTSLERIDD